ncbi:SDR family NAD(P)-dependent oxidoreductase [Cohnella soli]|uniref:SDR family NAD(P)-dependent oxidoreductase n=1 Tax=Cohnella soli TaxID=425005 RepID=A0ABW0HQC1_9BACL
MSLENKVVLVTGGAASIGRGIVNCFVREKARVVIADRDEQEGSRLAQALLGHGASCLYVPMDVAVESDADRTVEEALKMWGAIDVLVNNVGTHFYKPIIDVSVDEWDRFIATDLRGHFLMSKKVLPHMMARNQGSIVNISSIHSVLSAAHFGAYAAAKGGIVAMTRSMAVEYAPFGIRVNAVLPGWTRNKGLDMEMAHLTDEEKEDRMGKMAVNIPLRRIADPMEIGNSVVFLASDKASYITGSALTVDGGLSSRVII